jgi:hypothetical protein
MRHHPIFGGGFERAHPQHIEEWDRRLFHFVNQLPSSVAINLLGHCQVIPTVGGAQQSQQRISVRRHVEPDASQPGWLYADAIRRVYGQDLVIVDTEIRYLLATGDCNGLWGKAVVPEQRVEHPCCFEFWRSFPGAQMLCHSQPMLAAIHGQMAVAAKAFKAAWILKRSSIYYRLYELSSAGNRGIHFNIPSQAQNALFLKFCIMCKLGIDLICKLC